MLSGGYLKVEGGLRFGWDLCIFTIVYQLSGGGAYYFTRILIGNSTKMYE